MKQKIIKEKHDRQENALIVENYPYGFRQKTKIRYWIESNKKGDRFVSQTLNPKTNLWNKPKCSIYNAMMVLIKDDRGYISYKGLYPTTSKEEILNFLGFIKDYDLNDFQKEAIRILKAYSKVYENVSFSIREDNLSEEERAEEDKKQVEIQKEINKRVAVEYLKNEVLK